MSYKFTLPIYGVISTTKHNKNKAITLNWAMTSHYRVYNKAKKDFKKMILEQLNQFDKIKGELSIKYTYYAKRNGTDLDNFTVIVSKFFQDALSEIGLISDDNTRVITKLSARYGGLDRDNPRVEAEVFSTDEI